MADDYLDEKVRAEDILLGALGFGEEARLVSVEPKAQGYSGIACWADGEQFEFESEDEMGELEVWALSILVEKRGKDEDQVEG